jgi:hypothetical protein
MKEDFGVSAEWYFFATSHGRSAWDVLRGPVKIVATRVGLQQSYIDQIMTCRQMFSWVQTSIQNMDFESVTELEFIEEENFSSKINLAVK